MDVSVARIEETSSHGLVDLWGLSRAVGAAPSPGEPDVLDVPLHDDELALEVELLGRLMVAANEADDALAGQEVDRILDLATFRLSRRPTVP
jgi:hypothetical protein